MFACVSVVSDYQGVCVFMMFSPRPGLPAVSVVSACQRALVNESRCKGRANDASMQKKGLVTT